MTRNPFRSLNLRWRAAGSGYVVIVTVLTIIATHDPNQVVVWAWLAALALTLPTLVAMIPVIYVVVPIVWHVSGIDSGGPTWPTTTAYAACLALGATANVLFVHFWVSRRQAAAASRPDASASAMTP